MILSVHNRFGLWPKFIFMKHKKDNNFRQRLNDLLYTLCITGVKFDADKVHQFIKLKLYRKLKAKKR